MPGILNTSDNQQLLNRLEGLSENTKPLWGKMTAAQMVTHSQRPLMVAIGEMKLKRGLIGILLGKWAKKKLLSQPQFDKNSPTAPDFVVKNSPEFEKEKGQLEQLIVRFSGKDGSVFSPDPHPFFGEMTEEEWDTLQWKHLDHHLRQFGL